MFKKNKSQSSILKFTLILTLSIIVSCSTDSKDNELSLAGNWEAEGLIEFEINDIHAQSNLFLLLTSNGIYSKSGNDFFEFGLQKESVINIVKLREGEYLAAVQASDFEEGDTTLFKKEKNTSAWNSYLKNYGGDEGKFTWVSTLTSSPKDPNLIFATGGSNIARSRNAGDTWDSVYYKWGAIGFTNFLKFDPLNNKIIWAGGSNAIFEPSLLRSADAGDTWERLTVLENTEAELYDIAIHYQNSKHIIIGLSGGILKSTNNGETWSTVFDEAGILTLAHSTRNPETVYASGINSQGRLFFTASGDFGDSWVTIEFEDSPEQMYVNDMVSVMEDGQEVLYLGTNKGVYSYTFEE